MEATAPAARDSYRADLDAALQLTLCANTGKTTRARNRAFGHWSAFAQELGVDPSLRDVPDPERRLAHLLVFALRYRKYGLTNNPVRAGTVSTALCAVAKGISNLGQPDPRKQADGSTWPLLVDFFRALQREDSPTDRAYPVNTTILRCLDQVLNFGHGEYGTLQCVVRDLIIVGFFWLL